MNNHIIFVRIATLNDIRYTLEIIRETEASAIARGTGIAKRSAQTVSQKMREGKAVIAVTSSGEWVGFAYLETWEQERFISNSGLIVSPDFRNTGVARAIKNRIFQLSRRLYPTAKIFSITTGTAVMKMNSRLGFQPVAFSGITQDSAFWEGCKGCINFHILESKKRANCLCTAMLFIPASDNAALDFSGHDMLQHYNPGLTQPTHHEYGN